jgi:hypothetical protein
MGRCWTPVYMVRASKFGPGPPRVRTGLLYGVRAAHSGVLGVAEPPELFQLKCLSHASGVATHLNRNNPSVPQI